MAVQGVAHRRDQPPRPGTRLESQDDSRGPHRRAQRRQPGLVEAEPREQEHEPAEGEELGALLEVALAGDDSEAVGGRRPPNLGQLRGTECIRRIETALHGHERLPHRRMELRAEISLDLGKRFLVRQSRAVRPLARHRVEAVGDDQEVRGEREILVADTVVPAAVEAFMVELDGACLRRDELEALQEAG